MEEEIVIAPSTSSFPTSQSTKRICHVCQKQFSQYTCPRCNSRYCSLKCYKSHSLRCTESFMRENVVDELGQMQPDDETKQKMMDILKRFHSEEEDTEMDSMDEDNGSTLSEETIQKILSGNEINFEDLTIEERKEFERAIMSGELSKLIQPWEPWWLRPSARRISLSKEGTRLVNPIEEDSDDSNDVPAGPETPLPPLKKLISTPPSPFLSFHLVDIIYSYCFTLRLYNGDWKSDPLGAATVVLNLSNVLGENGHPESVSEALSYCLEKTCSATYRHVGGLRFGLGLLDDVVGVVRLGGAAMICLLCDLLRLIEAAEGQKGKSAKSKVKLAKRKVWFMMCWVHDRGEEGWEELAVMVEVEKKAIAAVNDGEYRKRSKGVGSGGRKSKVLIEEVQ